MSKMKILTASAAIGLIFAVLCSFVSFEASCSNIKDSVLRLHVLANSDSDEDQALKLKVRDAVLAEGGEIFEGASTLREAETAACANIERFTQIAEETIRSEGYDYSVTVQLAKTEFNTRVYGDVTLPAGVYDAVEVIIGSGEGKNWWCVMFPPLCLPAAEKTDLSGTLDGESLEITSNAGKYVMKFKVVEWYEEIKEKLTKSK